MICWVASLCGYQGYLLVPGTVTLTLILKLTLHPNPSLNPKLILSPTYS